ncbi:MAG: dTMP kinase [Anaerolineaceae bacterium]|nr:dTMP kinase [Anaerolineaceae bacterium]
MFITLEGPEGSGKSRQIAPLAEFLKKRDYKVITTREPGGTPISDQVRKIIMNMKNKEMHPRTEILLFCSARAQLVEEIIRPGLAEGKIILSDRYADSTLAYQGFGHGYDRKILTQLLDFVTGELWPDLTLLLDVDVEEGLSRRRNSGGEWNRLDDYEVAFHKRVRKGYLEMAHLEPERWKIIDASQTPEKVQLDLQQAVLDRLLK